MTPESYGKGTKYEMFIRRAHKCDRGMKHGADVAFLGHLIDTENQEPIAEFLPKFDKQFEPVKKYILKAIDKFLSRKPTEDEKNSLVSLREDTENASTSSEIVSIVENGLEITQRYINL
jgi:hypothetical protein